MTNKLAPVVRSPFIRASNLAAAKRMRRSPTASEEAAWAILRRKGLFGLKFRRQLVIAGFIVDFYCAEIRCCIEIDGDIHDDPQQRESDDRRTDVLEARSIRTLRIKASDVTREALETLVAPLVPQR